MKKITRSAKSGKFVSKDEAAASPETTVSERISKPLSVRDAEKVVCQALKADEVYFQKFQSAIADAVLSEYQRPKPQDFSIYGIAMDAAGKFLDKWVEDVGKD